MLIMKLHLNFVVKNGHLTVAKWLYDLGEVSVLKNQCGINIHACNEIAFSHSYRDGYQTLTKLYGIEEGMGQYRVDIHAYREYPFRHCCRNGHLAVAKWLYSLGGIDIHADDEYAFRWSYTNGHLTVAKWLYSLGGINIHAENEHALGYAKKDTLDWLNTLI